MFKGHLTFALCFTGLPTLKHLYPHMTKFLPPAKVMKAQASQGMEGHLGSVCVGGVVSLFA